MPRPFDPLRWIKQECKINPTLGPNGLIRYLPQTEFRPDCMRRARAMGTKYERLLRLQLEHGGKTVQWLRSHGYIDVVGGRYVMKG